MIHYSLYKNEKIAGGDRFIARVHSHGTLSREDVIKRALQRGTTGIYLRRATRKSLAESRRESPGYSCESLGCWRESPGRWRESPGRWR